MCAACGHPSVIAGTIFQPDSVVRLVPGDLVGGQPKKWRQRAQRVLGLGSYRTAWSCTSCDARWCGLAGTQVEVRGRAIVSGSGRCLADSLLMFVQQQPGSVVIRRAPELPPPRYRQPESAPWSWASRPNRVRLGTHQGGVSREHLDTSTSSPFGSIDEPHAIAALPSAPGTGRGGGSRSLRGDGQGIRGRKKCQPVRDLSKGIPPWRLVQVRARFARAFN